MADDLFVGLPKVIRIGPFAYNLEVTDKLSDEDEWGNCDLGALVISIKGGQPSYAFAVDTVMHEINHALWRFFALPEAPAEEHICAVLASGWAMVLSQNPELKRWLFDGL